jgi:hypothetical protein
VFEELLDRAARAESGRADNAALDRFLKGDEQPDARRRWTAYLNAEIRRRIGRFGEAQQWLNAAAGLSEDAPTARVWLADVASCQSDLELAFDEPDRALGAAAAAWRHRLEVSEEALSSDEALAALHDEIDHLFDELCRIAGADADVDALMRRAAWVNDRFLRGTLADARRLVRLAGSLGALDLARTARAETIAWSESLSPFMRACTSGRRVVDEPLDEGAQLARAILEAPLAQMRGVMRVELDTQLGDAEDAGRDYENAMRLFNEAAPHARQMDGSPYSDERILELELNSANQLAKLQRIAEAQAAYEHVLARAEPAGYRRIVIASRFGIVRCRWQQAGSSTGLDEQMAIAAELETMFLAQPRDPWIRGMLLSAYGLLVNMIAADRAALPDRLRLLFQIFYAARTPNAVAMLAGTDGTAYDSARFGVDVLLARWSALEGAVLLVWEVGPEDLVLTTLASGGGPLSDRMRVECIPIERASVLIECIEATREASERMSMRAIGLKRSSASVMEQAARAVWDELPASVRDALLAADTIHYAPPNEGALDELPLEALHDGEEFLGVSKVICRVPSLRHLSDLLAANRYRQTAPSRALLVRAKDPQRAEDDDTVKQQADLIIAAVEELSPELEVLDEPSVDAFGEAVNAPAGLLHFVGHGFAGEGGEVLVLSDTEEVPIARVLSSGGVRAPFTYFSACEVGRGRQMSSGAQRGLANTFLDEGAPAVLAPAFRIPSHFLGVFAALFYQQCATLPAGLALTRARSLLHAQHYHPACWATVSFFGDPYACLTGEATAARPERPTSWKSLVFQHLATQDPHRQQMCLDALDADPRLDGELKSRISEWLQGGTVDPQSFASLMNRLQSKDAEAAALLEILWTVQDVEGVNTESPQEAQASARARLRRCLDEARALEDSYAAISVIEALGGVGIPTTDLGAYRELLDYEHVLVEMLSDDSAGLERIATPLSERRQHLGTMTFVNLGNTFGYSDEDIGDADQGDPAALRRVALSTLERNAHPEALSGVWPWYVWLLRWGGTGTPSSCSDALAALRIDVTAGRLDEETAAALRSFVGELQFASPLDPAIVQAAVEAFEPGSVERTAAQLMLMKVTIETGGSLSPSNVQAALAGADWLNDAIGPTGVAAWYRTVLASNHLHNGALEPAAELADEAVDELAALPRDKCTTRLAAAVRLAMLVAETRGDAARMQQLEQGFASVLAVADTDEQRRRDGVPAGYEHHFR